ncbi:uncharacterized protein LOC108939715 isoform X2 [Scleropages formosus]|uniref:uncharacterized protein LOC108939715 isoform X2 n=1 Tax=Scleropages formosus TaxID=113540 RepID=UPI000878CA99|nr:uncharacterized protein LOC108939715 isoform X2 [Scleropages formosus]
MESSREQRPALGGSREADLVNTPLGEEPVKAHLRASQQLLVDSLYNIAPLLDHMLAANLLSQDNYFQVQAERTPTDRARKLLEVVHAQMDERGVQAFLDCLRKCENHYPRLRKWFHRTIAVRCGPTETRLRAQFSMLCHRLGVSVLPVSLQLFSEGTLTQLEVDQVQSLPTSYQQIQRLLSICLSKGENACRGFYQAFHGEDAHLAKEIDAHSITEEDTKSLLSVAVEESRTAAPLDEPDTDVLQKALDIVGGALAEGARLNVCELGVALGLCRDDVRDCLLEDVDIDGGAQLRALVTLFLEKTQDGSRLLAKLAECDLQRLQLSERGILLLELLAEADHLLHDGRVQPLVVHIFTFLLWDTLTEAAEEPSAELRSGVPEAVQMLRTGGRVEAELLLELEECWEEEPTVDSLRQFARALSLLIQDLYPCQDSLHLCAAHHKGELAVCRPRRLQRITRFRGLPGRIISRALGTLPSTSESLQNQYRGICLAVARLLERLCPAEGGTAHLPSAATAATASASTAKITQHVRAMLAQPAFSSDVFDGGVRHRLLSVLHFDPAKLELPCLLKLHRDSLEVLGRYLRVSERHSFQLHPDGLLVLGGRAELYWAESVTGPVAIDNGMEEVFRFLTSGPASMLMRICCHGYEDREYFRVHEPHCVCLSGLGEGGVAELQRMGLQVLGEESGEVWVREAGSANELVTLAEKHGSQVQEAGCCFLLKTPGPHCEVRFVYKHRRITASSKSNCEVI